MRDRYRTFQEVAGIIFALLATVMIANGIFLLVSDASYLVAFMVRAHFWIGMAFWCAFALFAFPHFLLHNRHGNWRARMVGIGLVLLLLAGTISGLVLWIVGDSRSISWLVLAHDLVFLVALVGYVAHRLVAVPRPRFRPEIGGAIAVVGVTLGLWLADEGPSSGTPGTNGDREVVNRGDAEFSPFGASRVRTMSGHWLDDDDLRNPDYCAQCHRQIADEWEGSAHRFSSFNDPFYLATFESLQAHKGSGPGTFCAGCHDPLVLLTGNFKGLITPETTNAQEGITCLLCHAVTAIRDPIGNGGYVVAPIDQYPFYDSVDPDDQELNRRLIRSKPQRHRAALMRPELRTSEFCLPCHKAHIGEPVNGRRWLRGQNDWDAWRTSSAAKQSARTFYDRETVERCQDCHMPEVPSQDPAARDGVAHDHSFPGANTALAYLMEKPDWLRKTKELLQGCAEVTIISGIVDPRSKEPLLLMPLDSPGVQFPSDREILIEVLIKNTRTGHMFPGGTTDLAETWLELTIADESERTILASGLLDQDHRLDETAHRLHSVLLTADGRKVDIHNVEDYEVKLYSTAIPLGISDIVRYRLRLEPEFVGRTLELRARLRHRKLPRDYLEFALGSSAPPMPLVTVAGDTARVVVSERAQAPAVPTNVAFALTLNDYGIAQFRQGNTRAAIDAFRRVGELRPDYADAFVNQARVHLKDGALGPMEEALQRADAVRPGYPKAAYLLGRLRAAQGRFTAAVAAYDRVLEQFPQDDVVLAKKGTALYKLGDYGRAIASFNAVLDINPEDVTANSYLSRCYDAMGDDTQAEVYRGRYLRYRVDETTRAIAEGYRASNPDANREASLRHVHSLHAP